SGSVLPNTIHEVVGHPNIECSISFARKNVNKEGHSIWFLGPRFRGDERKQDTARHSHIRKTPGGFPPGAIGYLSELRLDQTTIRDRSCAGCGRCPRT